MKDKYKHKFLEDTADDWYPFEPIVKPIKRKVTEKDNVKPKEKVKKRIRTDE
jgi:hypothetical protein